MTGAFLSNDCLRENVIDLSKFDDSEKLNLDAFSGSLFKDASERGDNYSFLMYMDRYIAYSHRLNMSINPSNAQLEQMLTDEFKKALAEESADRIVECFGTPVVGSQIQPVACLVAGRPPDSHLQTGTRRN